VAEDVERGDIGKVIARIAAAVSTKTTGAVCTNKYLRTQLLNGTTAMADRNGELSGLLISCEK